LEVEMERKKALMAIVLTLLVLPLSALAAFEADVGTTQTVCASETAIYILPVRNTGQSVEQLTITLSGDAAKWAVASPSGLTLGAGETKNVYLYVTPSVNALAGNYDLAAKISGSKNLEVLNKVILSLSGSGQDFSALSDTEVQLDSGESKKIIVYSTPKRTGNFDVTAAASSANSNLIVAKALNLESKVCYEHTLDAEENAISFCEKSEVKLPLIVSNKGTEADTYSLVLTGPSWAALQQTSLSLAPQSTETVDLKFFPNYGVSGDFKSLVRATGAKSGEVQETEITTHVNECHATDLKVNQVEDTICPLSRQTYKLSLANTGEYTEHFSVSTSGVNWVSVVETFKELGSKSSADLTVVAEPNNVPPGTYTATIKAKSQDSCETSDSDTISFTVLAAEECYGVETTAETKEIEIAYGEGALVPISIENTGTEDNVYNLAVTGTGSSFVQLNPSTLTLKGGEAEAVHAYIAIPEQTQKGSYSITVTARVEEGVVTSSDKITFTVDADSMRPIPRIIGDIGIDGEQEITADVLEKFSFSASRAKSLLTQETYGFANWLIALGIVVLTVLLYLAWNMLDDLEDDDFKFEDTPKPVKPKIRETTLDMDKKSFWERFKKPKEEKKPKVTPKTPKKEVKEKKSFWSRKEPMDTKMAKPGVKEEKKGLWKRFIDFLEEEDEFDLDTPKGSDKKKRGRPKRK
jgi:uncharacterized membrane protein